MAKKPEDQDELPRCRYEGFWSRLLCPHCDDVFEVEGDVNNGEEFECDACGEVSCVEGR